MNQRENEYLQKSHDVTTRIVRNDVTTQIVTRNDVTTRIVGNDVTTRLNFREKVNVKIKKCALCKPADRKASTYFFHFSSRLHAF